MNQAGVGPALVEDERGEPDSMQSRPSPAAALRSRRNNSEWKGGKKIVAVGTRLQQEGFPCAGMVFLSECPRVVVKLFLPCGGGTETPTWRGEAGESRPPFLVPTIETLV